MVKSKYVIGIDPGAQKHPARNNGFAVWNANSKKMVEVSSLMVHEVMGRILQYKELSSFIFVRLEDARQSKFGRNPSSLKGAGYVSAAVNIYESFLKEKEIPFQLVRPDPIICNQVNKGIQYYYQITGREDHPSKHAQVAALYCYDWKYPTKQLLKAMQ